MNQVNNLYVKKRSSTKTIKQTMEKPNHNHKAQVTSQWLNHLYSAFEVRQEVFLNRFLALLFSLNLLQAKPSCTQQRPSSPRRVGPGEATPGWWLCWSMAGHPTTWSRLPHWPESLASTSSLCPSPNLRPRSLTWCQTSTSWTRSHLYSRQNLLITCTHWLLPRFGISNVDQ